MSGVERLSKAQIVKFDNVGKLTRQTLPKTPQSLRVHSARGLPIREIITNRSAVILGTGPARPRVWSAPTIVVRRYLRRRVVNWQVPGQTLMRCNIFFVVRQQLRSSQAAQRSRRILSNLNRHKRCGTGLEAILAGMPAG